jgi:hypothetical protein
MNTPQWLDWSNNNIASYDKNSHLYRYTYGVKDIQVRYKEFSDSSVFVTKPYEIDGNILEVSLAADESNYMVQSTNNATSPFDTTIEYYITFKENPRYDEWIPILPSGQAIVNEYLFTDGTKRGKLRFQCNISKEVTVYKNGVKISNDHWSYCSDNSIVIDKYFDKYAIYTVSYYPDILANDPWNVELKPEDRQITPFLSPDGSEGEVFKNGTDRNGTILLSKTPYIDYEKINSGVAGYNPLDVTLFNGVIAGPNRTVYSTITKDTTPATKNVTDYRTLNDTSLKPYDPTVTNSVMTYPYFEYLQDGRKVYFTETFNNSGIVSNMPTNHGDAWIRVKYNYLRSQFRFKAILRNVSSRTDSLTPSINNYSLIFKVVR